MSDVVTYERIGRVGWITICRPDARNALSAAVREGLWSTVRRFNEDRAADVLVLTGQGDRAFSAGGDLKEMAEGSLAVPPADYLPIFGRNVTVTKPTIAAVNGAALAGGFLLAQMCDLCIASANAQFAVTEVRVGRGAPWATPLPWLIPPRIAMELLLTGRPIDANRGYEIGLVNQVVSSGELHATAQTVAESIIANAPLSVRAAKATVYLSLAGRYREAERIWKPVYESEDAREGPAAFRDRRIPEWKGR